MVETLRARGDVIQDLSPFLTKYTLNSICGRFSYLGLLFCLLNESCGPVACCKDIYLRV